MGEYAKVKGSGERVKIGTCESMYYLRADQARDVWPEHGNVDPVKDAASLLFRFPWPNEDGNEPGDYDDHDHGFLFYAVGPADIDHGLCQFSDNQRRGYLLNMPCPESPDFAEMLPEGAKLFRNGHVGAGRVKLVMQRVWEGRLVAVCECVGCGRLYRLPTFADAEPLVDELTKRAEYAELRDDITEARRLVELARRLTAGYQDGAAEALGLAS